MSALDSQPVNNNHGSSQPQPENPRKQPPFPAPKRPVARHACLACREKKVKCDGETRPPSGDGVIRHQRCSNCTHLNIECIFVRSQRGGKRKTGAPKPNNNPTSAPITSENAHSQFNDMSSSLSAHSTSISNSNSTIDSTMFSNVRQQSASALQQSFPSAATSPFFNNGNGSPPLGSSSEAPHSSTDLLQEKVRQLQREAANIQSQLDNNSITATSTAGGSSSSDSQYGGDDYPFTSTGRRKSFTSRPGVHHKHGPTPESHLSNEEFQQWGPPQGGFPPPHHRRHHHHHHNHGPPPPPGFQGGFFSHQHGPPHHQHGFPPPPPPPPPGQEGPLPPPPNFEEHSHNKRSFSPEFDNFNLPKITKPTNYIKIPDAELDMFDLPDWKTCCILIDLYYRYVHPSRPFLAPKHRLIYTLQVRRDASLLHAMFSTSCRYASSYVIPSPNLRDPQHWYFLAEKYWDFLDLETSLQALVLLMGALGPHGYVQQSIEGEERVFKMFKVHNVVGRLQISSWKEFSEIATKHQVVRYEDMIRTLWGSWKLNVFLRINRGFPFSKISDDIIPFFPDLSLPLSDTQFNLNLSLFDYKDNRPIAALHYKSWKDVEPELAKAAVERSNHAEFLDSHLIIIAIKAMEDIMDSISTGQLTPSVIQEWNSRISLFEEITNSSLYQVSHIKRKMVIINISKIFTLFILGVAKLLINISQCSEILLIKPHKTNANTSPDNVFNSLYEAKVEDIEQHCLDLTPDKLQHYITSFLAAIDLVRLVELGLGKVDEATNSSVPFTVIGGPLNFTPASEISSLRSHENWWTDSIQEPGKTMSAQVQTYHEFPDVWLQYPIFSVVIIANALTILSSSVILTKILGVRHTPIENGQNKVTFSLANGGKTIEVILDDASLNKFKKNFNVIDLQDHIGLCSRYIRAHGRFWPYVESTSNEADAIINYIDEVITKFK